MNEQERLQEVLDYKILNASVEDELDELTLIASEISNTPIALITIIDDKKQWFKSKYRATFDDIKRTDSLCQHSLQKPDEVLVIQDASKDDRVKNSILVTREGIKFYAGAPLVTPKGNVLGTVCVMDKKSRDISESQKKALNLLAKRVMKYLNHRKLILDQKGFIENSAEKLRKLTNLSPGVIFQCQSYPDGKIEFNFISEGISRLHPDLDPGSIKNAPDKIFKIIHPDDLEDLLNSIDRSVKEGSDWIAEYRAVSESGEVKWHNSKAKLEKQDDGSIIWYGTIRDVTSRKVYEEAMEQIAFDISHVLRRPVTSLLGLVHLYDIGEISNENTKEYLELIKVVSNELDDFTKKLNDTYSKKREIIAGQSLG